MDQLTIMLRRFQRNGHRNDLGLDEPIFNPEGFKSDYGLNLNIHPAQIRVEQIEAEVREIMEESQFPRDLKEFIFILDIVKKFDNMYSVLAAHSGIEPDKLVSIITGKEKWTDGDGDGEGDIEAFLWDKMKSYFFGKVEGLGLDMYSIIRLIEGSIDWTGDHIDGKVIELMTQDYNTIANFLGVEVVGVLGILLGDYQPVPLMEILQTDITRVVDIICQRSGNDPVRVHNYICDLIRG